MIPVVPSLPIETRLLDGVEYVLSEGAAFGLVSVRLVFRAGSASDGDHAGLSAIAWELCERGTVSRSRGSFHQVLEHSGAEWSMHVSRRSMILDLRVLQDELAGALSLIVEALIEPADRSDELESLLDEIDERHRCVLEDPGSVVARAVPVAMWSGTSWEMGPEGTSASRRGVSRDLVRSHRHSVLASELLVGIAAESPLEVLAIVREFVERIRMSESAPLSFADRPDPAWGTTHVYGFDADQGAVTVVSDAPPTDGSGWAAAALHSAHFGEGFRSPLIDAMRSRHGLSYEVGWHLVPELERGIHVFRAFPESAKVATALEVVRACWEEWATLPIPDGALFRAKSSFIGGRLLALETVERRMTSALSARRLGLPVARLWELPARIAELSSAEVVEAAGGFGWASGRRITVAAVRDGAKSSQWSDAAVQSENREPESLL